MKKICKKCNIEKDNMEFHKNKNTNSGLSEYCKICKNEYDKIYRKTDKIKTLYSSEKYKKKKLKYKSENYLKVKLLTAKNTARTRNIEFSITEDDFKILPTHCPLLNVKLDYVYGNGRNLNGASIDRIDNTKGYVSGNVWIISLLANTMKNEASIEQLITFSKNVIKNFKNDVD